MLTRKSRYFLLVALFICFRKDLYAFQCVDELDFLDFFHDRSFCLDMLIISLSIHFERFHISESYFWNI